MPLPPWLQQADFAFVAGYYLAAQRTVPAAPARTLPLPDTLSAPAQAALHARGIHQLYHHQAQALAALATGAHVVVTAGTAGGKSLCFQLPIVESLIAEEGAGNALCVFPTKALAHDQHVIFREWLAQLAARGVIAAPEALIATYDGDTPQAARGAVRRSARIVLTNPDMLHVGILPHHTRWATFLRQLRYVVVDEMHAYRGVFGSHVANVLRRLRRLCAFYGADPQFILTSATIANPLEHAARLIDASHPPSGRPLAHIGEDGSGRGERHVFLLAPRVTTDDRAHVLGEPELAAAAVIARLVQDGLQTIAFAPTRSATELLLLRTRDLLGAEAPIAAYRGGYLPQERREIERRLRDGTLRAVIATNALELGIDIGALDACVMMGYPGAVSSFWQQAGRAGRRGNPAVAILIATAQPLDQYIATHPDFLLAQPAEQARIAPDNPSILAAHVACAAFELPFQRGEPLGSASVDALLDALAQERALHTTSPSALPLLRNAPAPSPARYVWIGEASPASQVTLRSADGNVRIEDEEGNLIGEVEYARACQRVHPGAVYLHQAQAWTILQLDLEARRAVARQTTSPTHYTRPSVVTQVALLTQPQGLGPAAQLVEVTRQVVRYKLLDLRTRQLIAWGELDMPEQTLRTMAYWFALPPTLTRQLAQEGVIGLPNDYGPNWAQQRDQARQRDGYRCAICGKPESPFRQHHVHHVQPFRAFGYRPGENDAYLRANDLSNLITVCPACHARIETAEPVNRALQGLCYLLHGLAPLFVMCDPADLEAAFEIALPGLGLPAVMLYELTPDGVGLAEALAQQHLALLQAARERLQTCACVRGCPLCVGPQDEADDHKQNIKQEVLRIIDGILELEEP